MSFHDPLFLSVLRHEFKVKDEYAGRATRCPTCKSPVQVPDISRTQAFVPQGKIDGVSSSLHEAGVDAQVTLPPSPSPQASKQAPVGEVLIAAERTSGRYVLEGEIARGGMGAVLRGIDRDIRREVAVKFMLNDQDAKQKTRFVEEAQITGQLEHPNIVPVHELGVDAKKRLFFTMKMVRGRSLAQVLEQLGESGASATGEFSLGRLLTILVNICHALGYAHSRHVIHRDLKPANIMIGDFGEVYVMDWGLAKVLGGPSEPEASATAKRSVANASGHHKVLTNRDHDNDLTQDGAIMGTPAYMPPEQALGNIQAIDQRSDIYSLGGILYAILTLQAPIPKGGDYLALLMRAAEGNIPRPEERAPERLIPAELSAIAMKALAKEPQHRYQTVEAFRRDLELFLEGRSVSAKQDTIREQVWKLIKRNKTASLVGATAAVLLTVVLAWSSWSNYQAYQETAKAYKETEQANASLVAERDQKNLHTKRAMPAFVQAAHSLATEGKFDDALTQLDFTLEYDPKHAEARFFKGRILIAQKKFAAGRAELEKYLELEPREPDAKTLVKLCAPDIKDDLKFRMALAQIFQHQGEHTIAARLLEDKRGELAARNLLLAEYKAILEKKWPGLGTRLAIHPGGSFVLNLDGQRQIDSLEPLRGFKLGHLVLVGCNQLTDLSPLQDMPLGALLLGGCNSIKDFSPVATLPLYTLDLANTGIQDISFVKGMMTLRKLRLGGNPIDDLTPLQGLQLIELELHGCPRLTDLTPLAGMPLKKLLLNTNKSRLRDFRPLAELKDLRQLNLEWLPIKDLSPLKGLPLEELNINSPLVRSLAPLEGMQLTKLSWLSTQITPANIEILRGMKSLKTVALNNAQYSAADFFKRYDAGEFRK